MIKVAVVDDQALWVSGLSMIIEQVEGMHVVWTAESGEEALYKAKQVMPDVILMDIRMPKMNGVEATLQIKSLSQAVKIVVLTTFNDDDYIFQTLKNGASGYLLKDAKPKAIVEAIKLVYEGASIMEPHVAAKVINEFRKVDFPHEEPTFQELTERERDVAKAVSEGYNNKEIAQMLHLTEGTVKNHLSNILEKLNCRDRTQLAIYMLKKRP